MIPQKSSSSDGERVGLSVLGMVGFERVKVRPETPSFVVTLEAAVAQISAGREGLPLDRAGCLVVPARTRVVLRGSAPSSRVAILSFREPLVRLVARSYKKLGVDRDRLVRWLEHVAILPRTLWVHE